MTDFSPTIETLLTSVASESDKLQVEVERLIYALNRVSPGNWKARVIVDATSTTIEISV